MKGFLRAAWKVITYLPPVWVLVLQSVLFWQVSPALGHSDAIVKCKQNIKYQKAVKVGVDVILESTGLYAEHYDTNGDGKFDIVVLSQTDLAEQDHKPNPVFWIVDKDYDGRPDAIYIDKVGKGNCSDIVLYEDLKMTREESAMDRGRKL